MHIQPIGHNNYTQPNFQAKYYRYRILAPAIAASVFLIPGYINQYTDRKNYEENVSTAVNEYKYEMETEKRLLTDNSMSTDQFLQGVKNIIENSDKAPDLMKSMRKLQYENYSKLKEGELENISYERELLNNTEREQTPSPVIPDIIKDEGKEYNKENYIKEMENKYNILISGNTNDFEYTNTLYEIADMYLKSSKNNNYLNRLINIMQSSRARALAKMSDSEKQKIADNYDNKIKTYKEDIDKAYKAPREYHHWEGILITFMSFLFGFFGDLLKKKEDSGDSDRYDIDDGYGDYFYT